MCRGLISHNSKVIMGATNIITRIKAKGGVIIRIIREIRVSEPPSEKNVDLEQALAQMLSSLSAFMNEMKASMQHQATQLNN